jgi:hypothetical protein
MPTQSHTSHETRKRGPGRLLRAWRLLAPFGNGVAPPLDLDEDLDEAAEEDKPKKLEAHLGAQLRGHDELPSADDVGGDDHARTDAFERSPKRGGRDFNPGVRGGVHGFDPLDRGLWRFARDSCP